MTRQQMHQLQRYFAPRPSVVWALAITAIAVVLDHYDFFELSALFSAIALVLLGVWGWDRWTRPSDEEADRLLRLDLDAFVANAHAKLNLVAEDLEQQPLVVTGPAIDASYIQVQIGRDGRARYSAQNVVVLLLTREYLGIFQCRYNSLNDIMYGLSVKEVGYEHVVEVEVTEEMAVFEEGSQVSYTVGGQAHSPSQTFTLRFTSGGGFDIPTRAIAADRTSSLQPVGTPLDQVVCTLRVMLRNQAVT